LAILHGIEDGIFAEKNSKEGHEDGTCEERKFVAENSVETNDLENQI